MKFRSSVPIPGHKLEEIERSKSIRSPAGKSNSMGIFGEEVLIGDRDWFDFEMDELCICIVRTVGRENTVVREVLFLTAAL